MRKIWQIVSETEITHHTEALMVFGSEKREALAACEALPVTQLKRTPAFPSSSVQMVA